MRSLGSISSELCEMQRLRDSNLALTAKDAEWQRRIASRNPPLLPPTQQLPDPSLYLTPPPFDARYPSSLPMPALPMSTLALPTAAMPSPKTEPRALPTALAPTEHDVAPGSPAASTPPPSASTPAHSPLVLQGGRGATSAPSSKKPRPLRGIGKIRRHRMTKEEEARFDPRTLVDLRGSTAAKSRKMTEEERDIMLHKRRLRNRASAARSRDKQRKTIGELGDEIDELVARAVRLEERCGAAEREIQELRLMNDALKKENGDLKVSQSQNPNPLLRKTGSTLRFSMSSDMLDKIIVGNADNALPGAHGSSGNLLKIPSKLHLSLSTDKLSEGGAMPTVSGSLPPLSRNLSFMERLLDYASANNANKVQ